MRRLLATMAAAVLLDGCQGPTEEEENLAARGEHPVTVADPAPGDARLREGSVTPGERGSIYNAQDTGNAAGPGAVAAAPEAEAAVGLVRRFGELLSARDFAEARRLYAGNGEASGLGEEEFARRFDGFETIEPAVEYPARIEGAAGSQYAEVQLTLTGNLENGEPYSRTGRVTLQRASEVPGATQEQLQWHIVRVHLGGAGPAR